MTEMLIQKFAAEGRIIRGKWSDTDADGRELLCLYTALAGDADARPGACPSGLCPLWLAHLLPWMDDDGSAEAWPSVVRRVTALAPRLGELSGGRGDRLRSRWLVVVVDEALSHAPDGDHVAAALAVRALLERHGGGGEVSIEEWRAAWDAAADAADTAWAATRAAADAARAAEVAARAAWAATAARAAADSSECAAMAASDSARQAAVDRMVSTLLDMIEDEMGLTGGERAQFRVVQGDDGQV